MSSNVEVVQRSFEALNDRDLDRIMDCFHDDVVFDGSRIMEGVYEGKGPFRRFLEGAWDSVDFHHSDLSILEDGGRVIALASVAGAGSTSGVPVSRRIGYLYEFSDGLIVRQEIHPDGEALLETLGLGP